MQESKFCLKAPPILSDYWAQLGMAQQGGVLIKQVREGLAFTTLSRLAAMSGFSTREMAMMLGLSNYALNQGRRLGRLSTPQSDRLVRAAQVIGATFGLFEGNQRLAVEWLSAPQRGLGGYRPIEMLATGVEADAVLDLIGRLEHGIGS